MRKTIATIIIAIILTTLNSCSFFRMLTASFGDDNKDKERVPDTIWIHHTVPSYIATEINYDVDLDTMVNAGYTFEMPESMNADIDSLLDSWQARKKIEMGDMNTTLIKTAKGRSIMVQHDVSSPRPYSRINRISPRERA